MKVQEPWQESVATFGNCSDGCDRSGGWCRGRKGDWGLAASPGQITRAPNARLDPEDRWELEKGLSRGGATQLCSREGDPCGLGGAAVAVQLSACSRVMGDRCCGGAVLSETWRKAGVDGGLASSVLWPGWYFGPMELTAPGDQVRLRPHLGWLPGPQAYCPHFLGLQPPPPTEEAFPACPASMLEPVQSLVAPGGWGVSFPLRADHLEQRWVTSAFKLFF